MAKMKKRLILILSMAFFIAFLLCARITFTRDLRFVTKAADCTDCDRPLTETGYAKAEKFDVSFDAYFSKPFFGKEKVEGTVSYDGKTYVITNCLQTEQGYLLTIQDVKKPGEPGGLLTLAADLTHFYFMDGNHKYGPADSYEQLMEALSVFDMLSQSEKQFLREK